MASRDREVWVIYVKRREVYAVEPYYWLSDGEKKHVWLSSGMKRLGCCEVCMVVDMAGEKGYGEQTKCLSLLVLYKTDVSL